MFFLNAALECSWLHVLVNMGSFLRHQCLAFVNLAVKINLTCLVALIPTPSHWLVQGEWLWKRSIAIASSCNSYTTGSCHNLEQTKAMLNCAMVPDWCRSIQN